MSTSSNDKRTHWNALAKEAFAGEVSLPEIDRSNYLKGLMADLEHLAGVYGLDWDSSLAAAKKEFQNELNNALSGNRPPRCDGYTAPHSR